MNMMRYTYDYEGMRYTIDAPAGATAADLQAIVSGGGAPEAEDTKPGLFTELGRGLVRGAGTTVGGFAKPIEDVFDKNAVSDWFRETGQDITGSVAPRQTERLSDAWEHEGVLGALKSAAVTVSESAVPTLGGLLTGVLTKNPAAAMAVMGITGAPSTYTGIREQQAQEGADSPAAAALGTAASTALDVLTGGGRAVSSIGRQAILDAFENGMRRAGKEVLKTGAEEAGTEVIQNVIEQVAGYADPTTKQSLKDTLEAGVAGAVGGTFFGGVSEGVNSVISSRYRNAAAQVPALHTVDIMRPSETEGEGTRERIDIISAPTDSGNVVGRTADGKVFSTTLDDIETMRTPVEGEEQRSLRDILGEAVASRKGPQDLEAAIVRTLQNPEDQAAFNEIADRYEKAYGIPRERAVLYAQQTLEGMRAPPAAPEAAPEAAPVAPPKAVPVTPAEAAPVASAASVAPAPEVAPAAPVTPAPEVAPTTPTGLAAVYAAPTMKERKAAAVPVVNEIIGSIPGINPAIVPGKVATQAADQIARLAAKQQTFDPTQIVGDVLSANGIAPAPEEIVAPEEVITPEEMVAPEEAAAPEEELIPEEMAVPEEVAAPDEITVPEEAPAVPVTVLPAGVARGVKPVARGTQGTQRGKPVEGAKQLTEGMKAQQALNAEIEAARDAREISDAEVRDLVNTLRPPPMVKKPDGTSQYSPAALQALPQEQRFQWIDMARTQSAIDDMQPRISAMPKEILGQPNPDRVQLEQARDALQQRMDALQDDIVQAARAKLETFRSSRKETIATINRDFKSGKINQRVRDARLREYRVDKALAPRLATTDVTGARTEAAQKFLEVAKQAKTIHPVLRAIIAEGGTLGAVAERLLRIAPDVRVIVVDPETVRMAARNPKEKLSDTPYAEGVWVPSRKAIYLSSNMATDHVPVHEAVHPIIQRHVAQKTPEGRELIDIFDGIKAGVTSEESGLYGMRDAEEFASEIWGNAGFRDVVQGIAARQAAAKEKARVPEPRTVMQRIKDFFKNILGRGAKPATVAAVDDYVERVMQLTERAAARPLEAGTSAELNRAVQAQQRVSKGLLKAQRANDAAGFLDGIDEAAKNATLSAREKLDIQRKDFLARGRPAVLAVQPSSWIKDNIAKIRPGLGSIIEGIDKLDQQMRALRMTMQRALRRRTKEFQRFVDKNGQAVLSSMMTIARVNRVDVTAHANRAEALQNDALLNYYKGKKNARGVNTRTREINDAWDAWERLGQQEGGQELYKQVRQFYKDMYTALRTEQDNDIRNLGLDEKSTKNLIDAAHGEDDVDTEEALTEDTDEAHPNVPERLLPKEYFPFRRFGDFALLVQAKKRANRERYHFETRAERDKFMARRAKQLGLARGTDEYNNAFTVLDGIQDLRENIEGDSMMLSKMFKIIDGAKVTKATDQEEINKAKQTLKDKLYQTYLMTLPERSLRKQFLHAELVTGQSADALRVFKVAANQYSSQLPKVIFGGKIQNQIEAAYDTIKEGDPQERAKLRTMLNTYVGRVRATMDPPMQGRIEQEINNFTFLSMMSSLATAVVQPLTMPFQVLPRMASRYGPLKAIRTLSSYTPLLSLVQTPVETDPATGERWLVAPTIGNTRYIKNNPLRSRLWSELNDRRDLFSQKHADMLLRNRPTKFDVSSTPAKRAADAYHNMVNMSGAIFSAADQITREISGMTYAELEYDKLRAAGKTHDEAIAGAVEAAVRNTNETIGNYTELERPDLFRGNMFKRMIGFLRTYSVQRTAYYFRMLGALTKGAPTQTRLQAFNELSMVLAFTAMGAGMSANFGYSFICTAIDMILSAMLTDEEKDEWRSRNPLGADDADYRFRFEWLPKNFGPDSTFTRMMQRGGLSELTGWDFSTRLSQNDLWYRSFKRGDSRREDVLNFLDTNLAPQISQAGTMLDGIDEFSRGNFSKGFSKLMPAAVRGLFTAERLGTEGETNKAGDVIMGAGEFSLPELVGQAVGFAPTKLSATREMNRTIQAYKVAMKKERNDLFREFRDIVQDPDATPEDGESLREKIYRYNSKVPKDIGSYRTWLIEPEDLSRSLTSAATRDTKTYRGIEYAPGEGGTYFPYERREAVVQ